jgi:hypothetical protein
MAEINIVRKNKSIWPWVLIGIVALALLVWWTQGRNNGTPQFGVASADSTLVRDSSAAMNSGAVNDFVRFAETDPQATVSHEYTAEGLRKLAAGLDAVAASGSIDGVDVKLRANEVRERADSLERDPMTLTHARQTREAFLLAASVLQQVQETRFEEMADQSRQVMDAAKDLEADEPLLSQTPKVRKFFSSAATALRGMTSPR